MNGTVGGVAVNEYYPVCTVFDRKTQEPPPLQLMCGDQIQWEKGSDNVQSAVEKADSNVVMLVFRHTMQHDGLTDRLYPSEEDGSRNIPWAELQRSLLAVHRIDRTKCVVSVARSEHDNGKKSSNRKRTAVVTTTSKHKRRREEDLGPTLIIVSSDMCLSLTTC